MGDQWRINANNDVVMPVEIYGSNIQQPVDIQSRYAQTIQTHNAVSVALSGGIANSSWIDCNGFDFIRGTILNDAATSSDFSMLWSNDGVTVHGSEMNLITGTNKERTFSVVVKARYARVQLKNNDAAAHVMSAWAYLTT